MIVRTLTGQTVTLSSQVDNLNLMSEQGTYSTTENIALQKKLGRQILAACGPNALRAILAELPLYISPEHLKLITAIWLRLIDPDVQIGSKSKSYVQDYGPGNAKEITFEMTWGAGTCSRCDKAAAATGKRWELITADDLSRQGIRHVMALAYLELVQAPQRKAS